MLFEYNHTLAIVVGTGDYGQEYIEKAYEKLKNAHDKLTDDEKKNNPLPAKEQASKDGTVGVSSAFSDMGSRRKREHYYDYEKEDRCCIQ